MTADKLEATEKQLARAQKKGTTVAAKPPLLDVGTKVEALFDDTTSWYSGTIAEVGPGGAHYSVR